MKTVSSLSCVVSIFISLFLQPGCGHKSTSPYRYEFKRIGAYELSGTVIDLFVADKFVYLACADSGLIIIDASEPEAPVRAFTMNLQSPIIDVVSTNGLALLACQGAGMVVIDVEDPYAPVIVSTYHPQNRPDFWVNCVISYDNLAYLGCGYDTGLEVVDMTNPESPGSLGNLGNLGFIDQLTLSEDRLFARSPGWIENNLIYILDISSASSPNKIGQFSLAYGGCRRIAAAGGYLYFSSYEYPGLTVLDPSNPAEPNIAGQFPTPEMVLDICINGWSGYYGFYSFVAMGDSGLSAVSLIDPVNPSLLDSFFTDGYTRLVFSENNCIYLINEDSGLMILEFP